MNNYKYIAQLLPTELSEFLAAAATECMLVTSEEWKTWLLSDYVEDYYG